MRDKLMALAGDLREQAATALETIHSMVQSADFSETARVIELPDWEAYANLLAQSLIDAADELEQIAGEGDFKENKEGMRWAHPDELSYIYLKYTQSITGEIHTNIYGWLRQEDGHWMADVQKSPGHFFNLARLPVAEADTNILISMIEDVAHEVTPIVLKGAKYLDEN